MRDPYLTQEDATLPHAHEDQKEPAMIDNHIDEEEAVEPQVMMWLLWQTMWVIQLKDVLTDWEAGSTSKLTCGCIPLVEEAM